MMSDKTEKPAHRAGALIPIVIALVAFVVAMIFTALSSFPEAGLFVSSTGNISDAYYTEITPAGWTFSIWGLIYAFQALILVYALTTVFRRNQDGYLYYAPPYMPPSMYITYTINMVLNISWLLLFDRERMVAALIVLALIVTTVYIVIFESMRAIQNHGPSLVRGGRRREIELVWGLVHNGFGMYAAWTTIATLLNLAIVLTYNAGLDQELSCTICLGILAFDAIVYFVVDNFLLEGHTRYMFTPYFVLLFGLSGSLAKNWVAEKRNSIITIILLGVGVAMAIIKICLVIFRHNTKPLYKVEPETVKPENTN